MSDFISSSLHKKIDILMDRFYGAGVASHPTIIEQINYLLFMRALSYKDDEYRQIGITDKNKIVFDGELEKYRWESLLSLNAEELFTALEECYRKIPESTTDKTVRLVFRNAHIKLYDKPSLRVVLHEIDAFAKLMDEGEHKGKRDIFGDTYEYLLSKLAQAGTSGQFRTPRHIIEFLVAVVAPQKGETILDPAVGTAGFLVKAFEHMRAKYTTEEVAATGGAFNELSPKELSVLYEHTFSGFDSDEDMIKFGMMNLYLHGLQNARLVRQNTLTDTAGNRDKYDVILANPPFSGKLDRDSVAQELQMNTGATEVLFLRYMLEHLSDSGRAGVIVPEGVLFNASGAHTKIRQLLLENGLWCVVSLPAGVFNPYAGVKTSIVFFDKTRSDKKEVLFAKVEHDGFSTGAQRRPITKNDLPTILQAVEAYKAGAELQLPTVHVVSHETIVETKDCNLSGDRYLITEQFIDQKWPIVELESVAILIQRGKTPKYGDSSVQVIKSGQARGYQSFDFSKQYFVTDDFQVDHRKLQQQDLLINSTGVGTAGRVTLFNLDGDYLVDGHITIVRPDQEKISPIYLLYVLAESYGFDKLESLARGNGGQIELALTTIKSLKIPLPPLEVQQKIVDEIEIKQKAINHAREIIKTLERERAHFDPSPRARKEGWPIVKLGDVTSLVRGPFGGSLKKEIFKPTGYKVYEQKDAIHGDLTSTRYFVDETKFNEMERFQVSVNDLIMSCSGTLGRVSLIDEYAPVGIINQALLKITPEKNVLPAFLKLILESALMQKAFLLHSQGGVIQNVVSVKQLAQLELPLPPVDIQQLIIAEFTDEQEIVSSNQKLIRIYEQKIRHKLADLSN